MIFWTAGALMGAAAGFEEPSALDRQIAEAIGTDLAAEPVDRRLRLARCGEGVTIDPPQGGAVAVRCASEGWRIRVPLRSGTSGGAGLAELLVRRGEPVQLIVTGAGFTLSTVGTALDEGARNRAIRVKLPTSPQPVLATVEAPGLAAVRR